MAKIVITITDKHEADTDDGGMGVDVSAEFDPDMPAPGGVPDQEQMTGAQILATTMLMAAQERSAAARATRVVGEDDEGKAVNWREGDGDQT